MRTLLAIAFIFAAALSRAEIVTLTIGGLTRSNDVLRIDETQVAELKGFFESQFMHGYLYVENTNNAFWIPSPSLRCDSASFAPFVFRGPATINLRRNEGVQSAAFATFEVSPQAYRPDKSITVAPGAGGAVITLESSTDLVNWAAATNGIYTNLPAAKFFRVRAERVP